VREELKTYGFLAFVLIVVGGRPFYLESEWGLVSFLYSVLPVDSWVGPIGALIVMFDMALLGIAIYWLYLKISGDQDSAPGDS